MNSIKQYFSNHPMMLTLVSALVSMILYSFMFGWVVSLGFIFSLFVHEMGHYCAARYCKIDTTVPIFIPYMGALINFKQAPNNAVEEAIIGIAGPIAGFLIALVFFAVYQITSDTAFLKIAALGFFLNLFNLIPLTPLDGGRTVTAITPYFWLLGIVLLVLAFIKFKSFIILLVALVSLGPVKNVLFNGGAKTDYYKTNVWTKLLFFFLYFGLSFALLSMLFAALSYQSHIFG
jgi:Zn-dependent protease